MPFVCGDVGGGHCVMTSRPSCQIQGITCMAPLCSPHLPATSILGGDLAPNYQAALPHWCRCPPSLSARVRDVDGVFWRRCLYMDAIPGWFRHLASIFSQNNTYHTLHGSIKVILFHIACYVPAMHQSLYSLVHIGGCLLNVFFMCLIGHF